MFLDSLFQRPAGGGSGGSGGNGYVHPSTHPASMIVGIANVETTQDGKRITINDNGGAHTFEIADNSDGIAVFAMPKASIPYAPSVTVAANTLTTIGTLTGACTVTLGSGDAAYDNEWGFAITQGAEAKTLTLPEVVWTLGIAPLFAANTTTVCRLYYIGETLHGVWEVA